MSRAVDELWSVARTSPQVDAEALARAVEAAAAADSLDYRTQLLLRDSLRALKAHWGDTRFSRWKAQSGFRSQLEGACDPKHLDADPDEIGFPSLERNIVDAIQPDQVERLLRELSRHISKPTRLIIGGSISLIMAGHVTRNTEDIDIVDELPEELRAQPAFLDDLLDRYKLRLAHFQSHYLPADWEKRVRSLAVYDKLHVFLIDPYDIFVGKLFSLRKKDHADLNALMSQLQHDRIRQRLLDSTAGLRSDQKLLDAAKHNWFILFGEHLPA